MGESNVGYETDSAAAPGMLHHEGDDHLTAITRTLSKLGVKDRQFVHLPGVDNVIADVASRTPPAVVSPVAPMASAARFPSEEHVPVAQQSKDSFCNAQRGECRQL
ncbi:hypothetical protein K437DRAFT_90925 [Tilletiaria anomala UBC 951]|uniref:Uncharacterized protein n=1 Tax=Tilletiaria anomala (strain ATCC 24038 / CBS 436.72 / UBC 951) TaxID=1037660 RepID=A0A066WB47_TILAU|nr:uncharacterized protein K437DRAFT_90925 [Tilletiaria anomala UBC 951]KDN48000.1 hypothetical protein K437DRAFT_90925 [Tilletiaria anomala UBC 951]